MALSLQYVFQAPRLTPLALSVLRTIRTRIAQKKKDALGAVSQVTCLTIVLLQRVKEVVIEELRLQLHQRLQVARLSRVTQLVQVRSALK